MPRVSVMKDIVSHPLIPLEKNTDGSYPFPRMRCGILTFYRGDDGQLIWGCVESNRVGPITIAPPAGTQDLIVVKDDRSFTLELSKPFPDLGFDFLKDFVGKALREEAYQEILACLTAHGFQIYVEHPLATAMHETRDEHGVDLRKEVGRDNHLLKTLFELPPEAWPEKRGAASQCLWIAHLASCEGVVLNYTDKVEKKMRRNLGREFYEKGCWGTLASFKESLAAARLKFSSSDVASYTAVQLELIREELAAYESNITWLERMEALMVAELDRAKVMVVEGKYPGFFAHTRIDTTGVYSSPGYCTI